MSSSVPSVEERLRSSLVMCHALKHCALLADEDPLLIVPSFSPRDILRLFPRALDALSGQLRAMQAALPVESLNTSAPARGRER